MRYAQGGGLTTERRFRERIRYEAGERFARGEKIALIAEDLRVSERPVERWRRAWREGGMAALASAGPAEAAQAVRWPDLPRSAGVRAGGTKHPADRNARRPPHGGDQTNSSRH
ncbi:helix-turn-helix domain-containing protein [Streptomyces mirabilis]|uniref:helix-turn-helix domain-containing protein n=1 Tax=Streptomyces mirabilis TaxID=68239 RepID=UPI003695D937